jgi:hypothetical protein
VMPAEMMKPAMPASVIVNPIVSDRISTSA